jgi:hypothetical protein
MSGSECPNITDVILNKILLSNKDRINIEYKSEEYLKIFNSNNWIAPPFAIEKDVIRLGNKEKRIKEERINEYETIFIGETQYGLYKYPPFEFSFTYVPIKLNISFEDVFKSYEDIFSFLSDSNIIEQEEIKIVTKDINGQSTNLDKNTIFKDNILLYMWNTWGLNKIFAIANTNASTSLGGLYFFMSKEEKEKYRKNILYNLKNVWAFNSTIKDAKLYTEDLLGGKFALNLIRIT